MISASGYRALGLGNAVGASADIAQFARGVDSLVSINPANKYRLLSQARKLAHPLSLGGEVTVEMAAAILAGTKAAQVLERKDTVVTVGPLHADCVAADFVQGLDLWVLWLDKSHRRNTGL